MKKGNGKIIFELPETISLVDTIDGILAKNGLKENIEELFNKYKKGEELRAVIVKDAALILFEKKIPEEKLVEFLQKHLQASKEAAQQIMVDIKERLIPYARKVNAAELAKERLIISEFKEDLSNIKKPEVTDVEENAEKIRKEKRLTKNQGESTQEGDKAKADEILGKTKLDQYRESIE